MIIKEEKGVTGIDISISLIVITIFISMIASLIANININAEDTQRKTKATSYAIQEIEKFRALGYSTEYEGKGINEKEILKEEDILENQRFTGYHKEILIKDYVLISNDNTKEANLVKEITVEISYKLAGEEKNIKISTYISQ